MPRVHTPVGALRKFRAQRREERRRRQRKLRIRGTVCPPDSGRHRRRDQRQKGAGSSRSSRGVPWMHSDRASVVESCGQRVGDGQQQNVPRWRAQQRGRRGPRGREHIGKPAIYGLPHDDSQPIAISADARCRPCDVIDSIVGSPSPRAALWQHSDSSPRGTRRSRFASTPAGAVSTQEDEEQLPEYRLPAPAHGGSCNSAS